MCTAITYQTKGLYLGRTLDYEHDFGQTVTVTPRKYPFYFEKKRLDNHFAIIGMARVEDGYPLYFDAMNEKGLAMAGLNFVGNAVYHDVKADIVNVPHYAFISWVLSQCANLEEARALMKGVNLTGESFQSLPPAQLHWILADRSGSIVIESTDFGLHVYDNPVGVLTNNPPFPQQLFHLNNYLNLSPDEPENRFSDQVSLSKYSRGMGALGLPGDLTSQSRFVRAAFGKLNSISGDSEEENVSQCFHILETVKQIRGCCRLGENECEITRYASCCSAETGIYYYKTYENHQISAVHLGRCNLDGNSLLSYPLNQKQQIFNVN